MMSEHAYCIDCSWKTRTENIDERSQLMLDHALEAEHDVAVVGARPIGRSDTGRLR